LSLTNDTIRPALAAPSGAACGLTVGGLAQAIDGELSLGTMPPLGAGDTPVGRIAIDSREVQPGDVFWALRGVRHDGADFASEAFSRGATGVVAENRYIEPWAGCWSISVGDSLAALWQLAATVRSRFTGTVVAVTGSVGKTTARQMIDCVLSRRFSGSASPRNYNNHVGLPLSLIPIHPLDDYAVLELGASRAGEIASLADLAKPHVGVITCVGEAHLEGFGSPREIAAAKLELLEALPADGCAIVNGDDSWLQRTAPGCQARVVRFGRQSFGNLVASEVHWSGGKLAFRVQGQAYRVPVWGRHHLPAALAAIAVGRCFHMEDREIAKALHGYQSAPQRCQVSTHRGMTIVDDTYNASPSAMRAALELLGELDVAGRRIVVTGDMAELGVESARSHQRLGQEIVTVCGADLVIACGPHAREVADFARRAGMPREAALACDTAQEAAGLLIEHAACGDAVLVKGSRCMQMEIVVQRLQNTAARKAA